MDLKYNLALPWLLRDRSPLPVTTLEVIKDSPEFVTLASSEHLEWSFFPPSWMHLKGTLCTGINHLKLIYCERHLPSQCLFFVANDREVHGGCIKAHVY